MIVYYYCNKLIYNAGEPRNNNMRILVRNLKEAASGETDWAVDSGASVFIVRFLVLFDF